MTKIVRYLSLVTIAAVLQACGGGSGPATQPNGTAPAITTQPAAVTVSSGAAATFSVAATGTPAPAYQWKRNGADIGGATGSTYAIPAVNPADNGTVFSVTATNSIGVATSNNAVLTVNYAPAITTQPAAQTVTAGQPVTFSVAANGNPLPTYQWKRNGTDIAGAVASSYSIPTTNVGDNGASFTVTATNSIGSVTSTAAVLTVNPGAATNVAPAITTQPASIARVDGASATFSVVATGTPAPTYQWKANNVDIPGATAATLTFNAALANSGTAYTVVVTNAAGTVTSTAATLTVTPAPTTITAQPAQQSVVDGEPASFTVGVTGSAPLTYQWRRNGADIPGATNQTYNIATAVPANNGELYSVVVAGPGGTATSNNALLSVSLVSPTIDTQPVSQTVVQPGTATFSVAASGSAPLSFQWRKNGTNILGATNSSYTTPAQTPWPAESGSVYDVIVSNDGTVDGAGTDVVSSGATLTVTQSITAPSITGQPANSSVLEGGAASFTVTATGSSLAYQWQKQPAGGSFADIVGATSATYNISSAMYADNGAQYRVVVSNAQGSATSSAATLSVTQQAVSILAGYGGAKGNINETGTAARFSFPAGVAFDPVTGDTIVADLGNQTIRRITPAAVVTTVAGRAGIQGRADGAGSVATFNNPRGVVVGPDRTIYIADQANDRIRAIDTLGNVSTIAGSGTRGFLDGTAATARFNAPMSLALSGTVLYIADQGNNRIRKLDLVAGTVSTVAGTGAEAHGDGPTLLLSAFAAPAGVTVDPGATPGEADDVLYVADTNNVLIRKLDRGTDTVTSIGVPGGSESGSAATAGFSWPRGVAFSAVNNAVYVADSEGFTIRKIDLSLPPTDPAYVTLIAGARNQVGTQGGVGGNARFALPYGIAVNDTGTELRVANFGSDTVNKITLGPPVSTDSPWAGSTEVRGAADNANGALATFSYPRGLVTDSTGNTFVADSLNNAIRRVAPNGATTLYAGNPAAPGGYEEGTALNQARFNDPRGVAVDAVGNLYVADRSNDAIRRVTPAGVVSTIANFASGLRVPDAVAVGDNGIIYVANTGAHTIVAIDTLNSNALSIVAGAAGVPGFVNATGGLARFNNPSGIAYRAGQLYVGDGWNKVIRQINVADGVVTTLAGDGSAGSSDNAVGLSASFGDMGHLTVNNAGTVLYAVDYSNNTVRSVQLSGQNAVATVVGVAGNVGVNTGALPGGLNGPSGISVRPNGPGTQLIVTDGLEHVILSVVLP